MTTAYIILKLFKQLCGLASSGDPWFNKYMSILIKKLGLKYTPTPGELLFYQHMVNIWLLVALEVYVDETLAEWNRKLKLTKKYRE